MTQDPLSPSAAYRQIIDELVNETRHRSAFAKRVREKLEFPPQSDVARYNGLIGSLSDEQRAVLAEMLLAERSGAIHDVLADLSWWVDCKEVSFAFKGETMPVDQSGMGLHGDYIGRCQAWEWPNE